VCRALFASAWQQRDAALRNVATAAQAGHGGFGAADAASRGAAAELWRSLVPALSRSVADKVAVVATSALQVRYSTTKVLELDCGSIGISFLHKQNKYIQSVFQNFETLSFGSGASLTQKKHMRRR